MDSWCTGEHWQWTNCANHHLAASSEAVRQLVCVAGQTVMMHTTHKRWYFLISQIRPTGLNVMSMSHQNTLTNQHLSIWGSFTERFLNLDTQDISISAAGPRPEHYLGPDPKQDTEFRIILGAGVTPLLFLDVARVLFIIGPIQTSDVCPRVPDSEYCYQDIMTAHEGHNTVVCDAVSQERRRVIYLISRGLCRNPNDHLRQLSRGL